MALWKPDQTFYPSARMAMQAPREHLGYVVTFNPTPQNGRHDALCVLDLDPKSRTYSQVISRTEVPVPCSRTIGNSDGSLRDM